MNTRNGKIARLPASIRTQLNERLDDGHEGPELLDWLNALPEVQAVLEEKFNGVPVSKQNLSEWRQGGFQDWLLRRDFCDEARAMAESATELAETAPGGELVDHVATILAARFGGLITRWNGEVDEAVEAKARFLHGLCRSVVRLQRSIHCAKQDRFKEQVLLEEEQGREKAKWRDKFLHPMLRDYQSAALAGQMGGGERAMIYARCITEILADNFEGAIKIATDAMRQGASQPAQSEPVKPSGASGTTSGGITSNCADSCETFDSQLAESEPVKPSQSDLPLDVQADLAEIRSRTS
jgi:hypothetical protein